MNDNQAQLSIIIPLFNKWNLTKNCLKSLKQHTPDADFEVIAVDNCSSDETVTELVPLGKSLFGERFTAIRNEANRNFSGACNQGAGAAQAPLLFFLNNDTLVTPGWLPPLLAALDGSDGKGGADAAGPLLLYQNNTVQHLGVSFSHSQVMHLYKNFPRNHPVVGRRRNFQSITAAAMMLPKQLFLDAGGFFEGFKNGFEDVDLCLELVRRGKTLTCVPESVIYHLESQSQGRHDAEDGNSLLLLKRKGLLMRPDYHVFGLKDGFVPFLDEAYNVCLGMKEREDLKLRAEVEDQPYTVLAKKVEENPFWLWGHTLMARVLENSGNLPEAAYMVNKLVYIACNKEHLNWMIRLSKVIDCGAAVEAMEDALKLIVTMHHDPALLRQHLKKLYNMALELNDKILVGLYEEKLSAMDAAAQDR